MSTEIDETAPPSAPPSQPPAAPPQPPAPPEPINKDSVHEQPTTPTTTEASKNEPEPIETLTVEPHTAEATTAESEPVANPEYPTTPPLPPFLGRTDLNPGQQPWALFIFVAIVVIAGLVAVLTQPPTRPPLKTELVSTIADLVPVHARVAVGGDPVRELRRLSANDVVETDAGGRARLRLDSGASVILDGETKVAVTSDGIRLDAGRIFVLATPAKANIDVGTGTLAAVGSAVGIERRKATKIYVASGEISVKAAGKEAVVKTGETADVTQGLAVAPERGFDDWTGGLAAPWAAQGAKRGIAEVWGRSEPGQIGSPLTIRTQEVRAKIRGEVAVTKVATTFFNAGELTVLGDFRMGLPLGAIVSAFGVSRGDRLKNGTIALASRKDVASFQSSNDGDTLEWAGEGWVRGRIPQIAPGQSVTVAVDYVEWMPVRPRGEGQVVQYRFPLAGDGAPPLVGEFFISVDAGDSQPTAVAAGMGAVVKGPNVELRKSDFRASSDFVVDVELPKKLAAARAYVTEERDDEEPTLIVRTEVPRLTGTSEEGITLAVVLDTSASIDPALLDAGRAFIEALVKSLSDADRIAIVGADVSARAIGPAQIGVADQARKQAILDALGKVSRGGATDLGRGMEAAANLLPSDASSAMIVYVGDGWGSVGDRTAEAIRARLARRESGAPRVGAVLVGPSGNRRAFAELTRGSGPLIEVADSEDAARASVELLGSAIIPTVTGISVELGPTVSRIYPRTDVAAPQGSSLLLVGKLNGDVPASMSFTYRSGGKTVTEERALSVEDAPHVEDARRRWADARAQSMALAGRGREAVTDAALRVSLLTPWTAWTTGSSRIYAASSLRTRVLELGNGSTGFDVDVASREPPARALANFEEALVADSSSLQDALFIAAVRTLEESKGQLKACRDSRAALRPDLPGAVQVTFKLDGDGRATDVAINNAGDATLATCLSTIVTNLQYPRVGSEIEVRVSHTIVWPPIETLRGKKCSPTSTLAVPLRRGVWRERMGNSVDQVQAAYFEARRGCELASWTAKRAFLELALTVFAESGNQSQWALLLATQLEANADMEAASFLRKEALRRAGPEQLRSIRLQLLASERLPYAEYTARYEKAETDKARLEVVKTFLGLAPHDPRLRSRLLALLSALGEKDALLDEVRRLRSDPFVDATLIADAAHLLRKAGLEDDARRAYGEIAERAESDPWAHALLGDRFREEGWFDDATAVYSALEELVPYDAATQIRLALAHLGAQRIDVALRILDRVARTGGRSAEPELAELADRAAQIALRTVLARTDLGEADRQRLDRALAEMPALPAGTTFVVQGPAGFDPVNVFIERGPADAREFVRPRALTGRIGLTSLQLEPSDPGASGRVFLSLARSKAFSPTEAFKVRIHALVGGKLISTELELPPSAERMEVDFEGGAFGTPRPAPVVPAAEPAAQNPAGVNPRARR